MHEVALIKDLVTVLEREVAESEVDDVKIIYLEVGELHNLASEIINVCFSNIPKHEKLRNAKIEIKIVPVKVKCPKCGKESIIKGRELGCSNCLSRDVDIVSGNEFNLKGIEW